MERHDAKTRRPSLLAGGPEPADGAPLRARVLPAIARADATHSTRPGNRIRPWWWWGAALCLATAAAWLWWPHPLPEAPSAPPAAPRDWRHAQGNEAATLIEETPLPTGVAPYPTAAAAAAAAASLAAGDEAATGIAASAAPGPPPVSPIPSTAAGAGVAGNPFTAGRTARAALPTRDRTDHTPTSASAEPALLSTLLGHIQARPEPVAGTQSGMERTAGQRARDGGGRMDSQAANAEFRSWQIQLNLRDCPPANTAKGVACRRAICEVYAGRDPACPAG